MRRLLEKLSRNRSFTRKMRIGNESIRITVSPDAALQVMKLGQAAFDTDLIEVAERFITTNSNVWDVGANLGIFTFAAATLAPRGMSLAIEPDIFLASLIKKTASFDEYQDKDIRILPMAVSSSNGVARFMIANRGRASNFLESAGGNSQTGGIREELYVPALTLDTLLQTSPAPNFVKIDVEGGENLVLQGALKVISKVRPVFYIEVGKKHENEIVSLFKEHNYSVVSQKGYRISDGCEFNTLFIPNEDQKTLDRACFNDS